MKYIIFFTLLFILSNAKAQSSGNTGVKKLLQNATDTKVFIPSNDIAGAQANNWMNEVKEDPFNEKAWLNYYLWTRRQKNISDIEKDLLLSQIVEESADYVIEKPQYYLMLFLQSGNMDTMAMDKALLLAKNESWIVPFAIQYFIISGNETALSAYCKKLENENPMQEALYQYHYNVLMSADSNAVIYARGLNDLVPMAVLQQVYNTRKDIRLKYYNNKIENAANTYLCLSLGKEIIAQYAAASCTGLLVKISSGSTFSELREHVENDFDLSQLILAKNYGSDLAELYKNYLPSFIILHKYYSTTNTKKAQTIKNNILQIFAMTGREAEAKQFLEQ